MGRVFVVAAADAEGQGRDAQAEGDVGVGTTGNKGRAEAVLAADGGDAPALSRDICAAAAGPFAEKGRRKGQAVLFGVGEEVQKGVVQSF